MPADQAAGLRRRQEGASLKIIYCVSASASCALRVARAFTRQGRCPLVIDSRDRLLGRTATQALFDWPRQIERGMVLALPLQDAAGWRAPGVRADAAGLLRATRDYDPLVFDCLPDDMAVRVPAACEIALLTVYPETMQAVYALLKTRAATGGLEAILTGDPASCTRVREACARFLGATLAGAVSCAADENDAIATLAARMAGMAQGSPPSYRTGNT